MQANNFVTSLYQAVDEKNIETLSLFLDENVNFKLANFPASKGRSKVLEANQNFFNSIDSMQHEFDNIWQLDQTLICHGTVVYKRLDKTETSAAFASILTLKEDKICDYLVYADLSEL